MPTTTDIREEILRTAHDLVFERGFTGTTVDAILDVTGASKGAFFHHFPSKGALGRALIERYAALDADVLESHMARAEAASADPAEQMVAFIRAFEDDVDSGELTQPGCLFASYVYEQIPEEAHSEEVILGAIALWRERIREKLVAASEIHPQALDVDLDSLADHVWTVFEGGFVLARATKDQTRLRDQLAQLRHYLTLLFGLRQDGDGEGNRRKV
ncbi:MAG: TetR/AcrR family transcriptional regulator [Acidimicrobiia bacterium]|nr:TetR/AcrR family transcriptional regulator [Acidimicrobiia bacterium]